MAHKSSKGRKEDTLDEETRRKIAEISEIAEDDNREVRPEVVASVIESTERTLRLLKEGKIKPMTLEELDKLMESM